MGQKEILNTFQARSRHVPGTFALYSGTKVTHMSPMNEESNVYHAYLLRLWRAQSQGQTQWRASLESPHTGERQSFASLEHCLAYLREQFNESAENERPGEQLIPELHSAVENERSSIDRSPPLH
jgi:hypothetical protein